MVEQINDAVNENVATKIDIERLATKGELREEVAKLATKGELREEVAKLATKEEVAKLATKEEVEKLELHMMAEIEKRSTQFLKYMVGAVAAIVALIKALDLLIG